MRVLCFMLLAVMEVLGDEGCMTGERCIPYNQCTQLRRDGIVFSCGRTSGYICCPSRNKPANQVSTTKRPKITTPPRVTNPKLKMRLLPVNDCGEASAERISNGKEAELGQFPWMALLGFRLNKPSGNVEYLCGGTLINYRYVLTAAHCVNNDKAGPVVSIRLGELNMNEDPDCTDEYCATPYEEVTVEQVISHKNYNTPYLKNDIALIRLGRNITRTSYIAPICLPFTLNITGNEEKKYTAAGWGKTDFHNVNGSDTLMYAKIPSSPLAECNEVQAAEVKPLAHTQLCAGGIGGQDACRGDSGGPLMDQVLDNEGTARTYQVGVVSFGTFPCGAEGTPSVYTKVNAYLTWILEHLQP